MVAEHSHKKDGQICAAISKKKRKKIIFLQEQEKIFSKLKKLKQKQNWVKEIKTKQKKLHEKIIKEEKQDKTNKPPPKMQKTKNKTKKIKPFINIATPKAYWNQNQNSMRKTGRS